ncbi:hypothetical protein ACFL1Q_01620, partial [Patescibacteria group bacterium]
MIYLPFLLAVFANFWIYKVFSINILAGILLVIFSFILYKSNLVKTNKHTVLIIVLFSLLLMFQYKTTKPENLFSISNDQRRVIDARLRAYPPNVLRVGYWLEERKESIAAFRVRENMFENLSLNLYFFSNHPAERVGIRE